MGLTLGRKVGQSIWIDDTIKITVKSIQGSQVKIQFDAPIDVVIRRDELDPTIFNSTFNLSSDSESDSETKGNR